MGQPHRASVSGAHLPPGPKAPAAAQVVQYGLDPFGFLDRAARRYGDIFTIRIVSETWVIAASPAAVKEIYALGPEQADAGVANLSLRPVLGTRNTLLLDGEDQLRRRRTVLPSFSGPALSEHRRLIANMADRHLDRWPVGGEWSALDAMQDLTYDIILSIVFGGENADRISDFGARMREFHSWSISTRSALFFLAFGPDRLMRRPGYRRRCNAAHGALMAEIDRRRREGGLEGQFDVLTQLIGARNEDGSPLSDQDLIDEISALLIAGHHTMTAILAWLMYELARMPEAQDRVASDDQYALAAVRETMRLHPAIPVAGIRTLRQDACIGGWELKAGTTVAPSTALVQRRADLFPDPLRFDPERFLASARPPGNEWFPFGGGARRCLGSGLAEQEMRMIATAVTSRFQLAASKKSERVGRRGVLLVPGRGAQVSLTTRRSFQRSPRENAVESLVPNHAHALD